VNDGGQRRAAQDDPETGLPIREITSMDVREVGPVLNPAYPTTDAALRSIGECLGIPLGLESGAAEHVEPESDETKNARALVRALNN
jgi:hypothetical protein